MRIRTAYLATAALALVAGNQAYAQNSATAAPSAEKPAELEDIVVTAERREASLQRVPISVTALTSKALEQKQISDVVGLTRMVPGLQAKPTLSPLEISIAIRGVTQLVPSVNMDPAIGSYIDGIYNVINAGSNNGMIDMERVEVLKGPQGTLFGRNTIGGAISITTAKPKDEFGGYVEASYGNYDAWTGTGVLNLPIAPGTLDTRVVYQHTEHGGYGHNFTNGNPTATLDQDYVRGSAKLDVGNVEALVSGFYLRGKGFGFPTTLKYFNPDSSLAPDILPPTNDLIPALNGNFGGQITDYVGPSGTFDSYADLSDRYSIRQYGFTGTLTAKLSDAITLKSITGYTNTSYNTVADLDGTPYVILQLVDYPIHAKQISEEVQLYGNALDDKLKWIVGGYYFNVKADQTSQAAVLADISVLFGGVPTINKGGPVVDNSSYSAFAQLSYEILPDLRLTGGIRFVKDNRAVSYHDHSVVAATDDYLGCSLANYPGGMTPSLCSFSDKVKYSYKPWTIGLDYAPQPGVLVYAKLSQGYRSGAFPLTGPAAVLPGATVTQEQADAANARALALFGPVAPEKLISPEIGAKLDLLDRRLRVNVAAYYSNYGNIQQTINSETDPNCPTCTPPAILTNTGKAHILGGELEVTALLGKLQIDAALGYTQPKYVSGPFVGTPIVNVSKLNSALSASYPVELSAGTLTLSGSWSYRSKMVMYTLSPGLDTSLLDSITQKGFSLFDARASLDLASLPVTISVYGANIFNKKYFAAGTSFAPPLSYTSNSPGQPRLFGISARYNF